jgi:hypothetical protein
MGTNNKTSGVLLPRITAAFYLALVGKGCLVTSRALADGTGLLVTSERQDYQITLAEFEKAHVVLDEQKAALALNQQVRGVDAPTFFGAAVLLSIEAYFNKKGVAV